MLRVGKYTGQRKVGACSVIYPKSHIPSPQGSAIWPYCERSISRPSSCQLSSTQSIKWMHKKKVGGPGIFLFPSSAPPPPSVIGHRRPSEHYLRTRHWAMCDFFYQLRTPPTPTPAHTFLALSPETTPYLPATSVGPVQAQHDVRRTLHLMAIPPTPDRVFSYPIKLVLQVHLLPSHHCPA